MMRQATQRELQADYERAQRHGPLWAAYSEASQLYGSYFGGGNKIWEEYARAVEDGDGERCKEISGSVHHARMQLRQAFDHLPQDEVLRYFTEHAEQAIDVQKVALEITACRDILASCLFLSGKKLTEEEPSKILSDIVEIVRGKYEIAEAAGFLYGSSRPHIIHRFGGHVMEEDSPSNEARSEGAE